MVVGDGDPGGGLALERVDDGRPYGVDVAAPVDRALPSLEGRNGPVALGDPAARRFHPDQTEVLRRHRR